MKALKVILFAWLVASCLAIAMVIPGIVLAFKDNPNQVKHSMDATLIAAHDYAYSTGKYSSSMGWRGKFLLPDGRTIDQDIDGFFYKNFIKGGEKPIPSWISVSGSQLGKPDPKWVEIRNVCFGAFFFGLLSFCASLCCIGLAGCYEEY